MNPRSSSQTSHEAPLASPVFATTRWTVVLLAGQTQSDQASSALELLCRTYWYPLYAFVRRLGHNHEEAQDLTQAFFVRLLQKDYLALADRQRGRFRTFLLTALKNFLVNEWEKGQAQRRGGNQRFVDWAATDAEGRFLNEPVDGLTPELMYERRWVATLLEQVLAQLREEARISERQPLFERLKEYFWGDSSEATYSEIAIEFNMTETAVKGAAYRLRQRFRELLRAEIAHTVPGEDEIEDELRHLIQVMSL
jgi:RNA polymerase sigma-70 factor (ECF subfamily)